MYSRLKPIPKHLTTTNITYSPNFIPTLAPLIQLKKILHSIRDDFKHRIASLTWMDEVTKSNAMLKIASLADHVGYPGFIKSATELDLHYEKVCLYKCFN